MSEKLIDFESMYHFFAINSLHLPPKTKGKKLIDFEPGEGGRVQSINHAPA